jgi:hypothetical protein
VGATELHASIGGPDTGTAGFGHVSVENPAPAVAPSGSLIFTVRAGPIFFTDDPITAGHVVVKSVHLEELRQAITDLRTRYGLTAFGWTEPTPGGGVVRAVHITDLRAALNDVYLAASQALPTYRPIVAGQSTINASDIAELRTAVLAIW